MADYDQSDDQHAQLASERPRRGNRHIGSHSEGRASRTLIMFATLGILLVFGILMGYGLSVWFTASDEDHVRVGGPSAAQPAAMVVDATAEGLPDATQAPVSAAGSATPTGTASPNAHNPIVIENEEEGSNKWQLGLAGFKVASDVRQEIAGYASATSVNKGEKISFYVTVTPAQAYTVDIYRIGWYDGRGGRLMRHFEAHQGVDQPDCPPEPGTGLIACNWSETDSLVVPETWTSGIYLALLTNAEKVQNHIIFVVRDDKRKADLLYQQSVTTYQAYNNYPDDHQTGKSLYVYNSYGADTIAGRRSAVRVSFDRPYNYGSSQFMNWEINFVRWLERSGYDVAYSTDIDTHANGSRLLNYKGFLSVGHDEYWSKEMYDAVEAARDAGVNIGFFGGNAAGWQVRFEPSARGVANRVMVCYKNSKLDPIQGDTMTVEWRDPKLHRAEQGLIGVQYTGQLTNTNHLKNNVPYIVTNSSHWVYEGTGFKDGDSVPGLVGYEADRYMANYPLPINKSFTLLSNSPFTSAENKADYSNAAIYQSPSGAWVFASGTIGWAWGLDAYNERHAVDLRIQKMTANILNRFVGAAS